MRAEKQLIVEEIRRQVGSSPYVLLTDYSGLTVQQFAELRRRLKAVSAEYHVVKNTLLQRALEAAGLPKLNGALAGMTAVVTGGDGADVSAAARVLKQFYREFEKPKFKASVMGGQALSAAEIAAIAELPSLEELRGRIAGLLQEPARRLAVVLGAPAGQIARLLKAHAEKQQGTVA
jgi:large subunit ribosomal protein L10